jgi:hypothetical protein
MHDITTDSESVYAAALACHRAGVCAIRARADGSKRPKGSWKRWETERPTKTQLGQWFAGSPAHPALGVVTGEVSGGLEMLEFEGLAVDEGILQAFLAAAEEAGLGDLVAAIRAGWEERSPSGGVHWFYRCSVIKGNQKLAQRPATDVELQTNAGLVRGWAETRGEGGFVVLAPSGGATHSSGRPWELVSGGPESVIDITPEEREPLLALVRSFDKMPLPEPDDRDSEPHEAIGGRPGDDFNARGDWGTEVLIGWPHLGTEEGTGYWCRPGKDGGISATTNHKGSNLLYVFSTSTPLEAERGISKFQAYTVLHHGGDHAAAAAALRAKGYGDGDTPQQAAERMKKWVDSVERPKHPAGTEIGKPTYILQTRRYSEIKLEQLQWLWEGWMPAGTVIELLGHPYQGKSTVTIEMIAHVTTGTPWPDGSPCHIAGDVFLASYEDAQTFTTLPRLLAAGADVSRVHDPELLVRSDGGREEQGFVLTDRHIEGLKAKVIAEGIKLIVIDPLAGYLDEKTNSYSDQHARAALRPLQVMASETGVCVLLVRHMTKGGTNNAVLRGGGSIGFSGAARLTMLAGPHPEDPNQRILTVASTNLSKTPESLVYEIVDDTRFPTGASSFIGKLNWVGTSSFTSSDMLTEPENEERGALGEAEAFVRSYLADGSKNAATVTAAARKVGISDRTLRRARMKVAAAERVGWGSEGEWRWTLREGQSGHSGHAEALVANPTDMATMQIGGHKGALHNREWSWGLNPPASRRHLAM